MNKADLIAHVADAAGISKKDADKALEAVLDGITAALKGGGGVSIFGFGAFSVTSRAATTGRNPKTGAEIQIAASKAPKFSASKTLKDAMNE